LVFLASRGEDVKVWNASATTCSFWHGHPWRSVW
jgi:hypothetical protein